MITTVKMGEGIQSLNVSLTLIDVWNIAALKEEIQAVNNNHKAIAEYDATPYDKRVDENGNKLERPRKLELDEKSLEKTIAFLGNICRVYGNIPSSNVFDVHPDMANVIDSVAEEQTLC